MKTRTSAVLFIILPQQLREYMVYTIWYSIFMDRWKLKKKKKEGREEGRRKKKEVSVGSLSLGRK